MNSLNSSEHFSGISRETPRQRKRYLKTVHYCSNYSLNNNVPEHFVDKIDPKLAKEIYGKDDEG